VCVEVDRWSSGTTRDTRTHTHEHTHTQKRFHMTYLTQSLQRGLVSEGVLAGLDDEGQVAVDTLHGFLGLLTAALHFGSIGTRLVLVIRHDG
jgi:hypothetical protein